MSDQGDCPIPGCTRSRRPGELLCPMHWQPLPTTMKCRVWNTWRAFTKAKTPKARLLARLPYFDARQTAIDHATRAESSLL